MESLSLASWRCPTVSEPCNCWTDCTSSFRPLPVVSCTVVTPDSRTCVPTGAGPMPTINLTKRAVDAAEPERGAEGQPRTTICFDRDVKGFGLLVTELGSKSFVVKYRAGSGRGAPTRRVTRRPLRL